MNKLPKRLAKVTCSTLVFLILPFFPANADSTPNQDKDRARNIVFMVPDGLGLSNVTAARILKNGPNGKPLAMENFPHIGYQRTHSADSTVTDSAAAASAWACGEKFNNREISCHSKDLKKCRSTVPDTILEIAQQKGKATGLVVTSQISHATPAAFGAHSPNRYCGAEIARQFVSGTKVDVILGGGVYKTKKGCNCQQFSASWEGLKAKWHNATCQELFLDLAKSKGYAVVDNKKGLQEQIYKDPQKLLGIFKPYRQGKTPELFRLRKFGTSTPEYPDKEPTLPEMTKAALEILQKDNQGFFLLVEGSQIDWANHTNDDVDSTPGSNAKKALKYQLAETLAFNQAVKVVKDWIAKKPSRKENTLVAVVPDHDTGGFAINGPHGSLTQQGNLIKGGWTTGSHTAEDTLIWSRGPGSRLMAKPLDNTDLYGIMKQVME